MGHARILVVEDDAVMATHLRQTLQAMDYQVPALAATGEDAVAQATALRPDVVLMDIRLRGRMSGVEAAAELRKRLEIPVVFLTAYADESLVGQAKLTGPYAYLAKPLRDNELRASIEIALYRSQTDRRLKHLSQVLRAVRNVDQLITREKHSQRLLDQACQIVLQTRGYRIAWVYEKAGFGGCERVRAKAGEGVDFLETLASTANQGPKAQSPCSVALESRLPVVYQNVAADPAFAPWRQAVLDRGFVAMAAIPMIHADRLYGALCVCSDSQQAFDDEEVELLMELTGDLAYALHGIEQEAERRRAEEALKDSNRALEGALLELRAAHDQITRQERLRAMGEMASGIAHDLSNALSPIVGYAELLLLSPQMLDDRPTTLEFLQTIQKEAVQASEVVKRLKEFYRAHEGGAISQPVDLNRVVEESVVVTAPKWRDEALARGLVVTIEKDLTEVPKIAGDAPQLQNVMTNLIFNAVDALKRQGTIRFHTWPEGDWVVLEVSDTGSGMTEEVRRRCQEPFFTTKGPKGTGMGLSMVQGIIKRHQGTIDIRSEVGRGTTFVIRLPVWKAPAAGANEAPEQVSGEVGQLHILTVDDEQTVRDIVRAFLRSGGHAVETTGNGREALEKFRSGKFDLVVTDMAMPEMAGDELAAAVKAISPGTPVILLTGFGELLKFSGQAPKGVDQVVNKPVKAKTLLDAVRRAWAGRKE